jgi:predicted nucleic acid-binding protein
MDYLEDREPHARHAQALFAAAKNSEARLWVSGDTASTIYYVLEKGFRQSRVKLPALKAQAAIRSILQQVSVAPVNKGALERALDFHMKDYEDAIQAACAIEARVGTLVTRDRAGYRDLPRDLLAVLTPPEAMARLGARTRTR